LSANNYYKEQKHLTKDIHIAMFQSMAEAFLIIDTFECTLKL